MPGIILAFDLDQTLAAGELTRIVINTSLVNNVIKPALEGKRNGRVDAICLFSNNNNPKYIKEMHTKLKAACEVPENESVFDVMIMKAGLMDHKSHEVVPMFFRPGERQWEFENGQNSFGKAFRYPKEHPEPIKRLQELKKVLEHIGKDTSDLNPANANNARVWFFDDRDREHFIKSQLPAPNYVKITPPFRGADTVDQTDYAGIKGALGVSSGGGRRRRW